MFKNVATKIALFAFDTTTGAPKTGDAANLTAYVSKDYGATTVLADTSATEQDATNAKGWYLFDVAQAESNADALLFTAKSTTANISIVGQYIFTTPNRFTAMVIDAAGIVDANAVKVGPTGSGTAQTAKDLGASATQTGDNFARLGAPVGASISADVAGVQADTDNIQTRLPTALVGGRMDSSLGAVAAGVDFSATMKTALNAATPASVVGAVGSVTGNVGGNVVGSVASVVGAVGSVTGNVGGNVTGSVGSVASGGIAAASFAAGAIDATAIATDALGSLELAAGAASEIATAVRTELGTELGRIDVATSTRLAAAGYTAPDNTSITAIKGKTDNLPSDPADESLIIAATDAVMARLGAPAGASMSADIAGVKIDTGAIKSKTDNLPTSPAAVSDIPTAAAISDEVWDEPAADHVAAGSMGAALGAAGAAGDPWATALPGSYGVGTAGKIVGDNLNGPVGTAITAAASAATDASTLVGRLTSGRAANLDDLDAPISGLPTAAENADGLLARSIAGGADGGHKVGDALKPLRNKTEIVGLDFNVYEDDGSTLAWTAPITRAPGDPLASIAPA